MMDFISGALWVVLAIASYYLGVYAERRRQSVKRSWEVTSLTEEVNLVRDTNSQCEQEINAFRVALMAQVGYSFRLETYAKGLQEISSAECFVQSPAAKTLQAEIQVILDSAPPIVGLISAIDAHDWGQFYDLMGGGEKRQIQ